MGLKTGIYSGSFNPIHIGHLALANWLCEFEGLDEVWFVVTPHNPLKKKDDLLDDSLRLEMAQAAIDGCPKFRVCDIEFYLPKHEKKLQDYKLLIYPRLGFDISIPAIYPNVKKVDAPLMEISSTFIRNAYQTGKDIRFFLPEGVRPYFGSVANQ